MSTQIDIIIYTVDADNIYILSTQVNEQVLPSIKIDKESIDVNNLDIEHHIRDIIQKYTNMDNGWLKTKLIDIQLYYIDETLSTHIYYSCYIPHSAKIAGDWIAVNKKILENKVIKKILCLR